MFNRARCTSQLLAFALVAATWGCGAEPRRPLVPLTFDGQATVNDRCPIRKGPLNPRIAPVWVNGRPIGFC